MHIQSFFDKATFTVTYVVSDLAAKVCAIIDPVLDTMRRQVARHTPRRIK